MNRDGAHEKRALRVLHDEIIACRACKRLVAWREKVARERRAMFRDWEYWGRPITGFGDRAARIVIVGLAPAAHGGNRTGRIFTGDRSGDFLFAALHRAGLASQAQSVSRDDGLSLRDTYVVAPVRCAPPDNKPTPDEFVRCQSFFDREIALLPERRVFVALGAIAWRATLEHLRRMQTHIPSPRPEFAHGAVVRLARYTLVGSYHVSQRNTQTGMLTERMLDEVLRTVKSAVG